MSAALQLPERAAKLLAQVDSGEVLGASRQLHVLGECLTELAAAFEDNPVALRDQVVAMAEHVRRTRGASSQAVTNGITLMTRPVSGASRPAEEGEFSSRLRASVEAFTANLSRSQESLRDHAAAALTGRRTVLAYDYSSSVSQALAQVAASGVRLRVFVPEARSLDGGRKYLGDWGEANIAVDLVPDAAMGWALRTCDAALVGAETLSAEGGCYNTVGTALVAHEASRLDVPFYVLSILLKTDLSTSNGERRSPTLDFLTLPHVALGTQHPILHGEFPDLDYTEPDYITSVVTDRGSLAPSEVADATRMMLGKRDDADA